MSPKYKKHTVRFEMVLTKEQNDHWQALAKSCGISKAELIRRRMSGCHIKSIPEVNWKCYWQLSKISKDISQLASCHNIAITNGLIPSPVESIPFEDLLKEISSLRLCLVLENNDEIDDELEISNDWQD
ncbi:MAG: hypothetical protein KI793_21425 [Rivularia sp. (in: Bacteria)]|nr:hypothetical protein [Rivularia sp. MS3]